MVNPGLGRFIVTAKLPVGEAVDSVQDAFRSTIKVLQY